jgi:hypothetical protein
MPACAGRDMGAAPAGQGGATGGRPWRCCKSLTRSANALRPSPTGEVKAGRGCLPGSYYALRPAPFDFLSTRPQNGRTITMMTITTIRIVGTSLAMR